MSYEVKSRFDEVFGNLIGELKKAGFKIYATKNRDWYLYFMAVKDDKISMVQYSDLEGFTVHSKHKPANGLGSGFQIVDGKGSLMVADVEAGFAFCPIWHNGAGVVKYKNWEEYVRLRNVEYVEI